MCISPLALNKQQRQKYLKETNKVLISSYWSLIESSSISSTDLNMMIITSCLYLQLSFDLSPTIFCKLFMNPFYEPTFSQQLFMEV